MAAGFTFLFGYAGNARGFDVFMELERMREIVEKEEDLARMNPTGPKFSFLFGYPVLSAKKIYLSKR